MFRTKLQETFVVYDCLYVQSDLSIIYKSSHGVYSIVDNGIKLETDTVDYAIFYMSNESTNTKWITQPYCFEFDLVDKSSDFNGTLRIDTNSNVPSLINNNYSVGSHIRGTVVGGKIEVYVDNTKVFDYTSDNGNSRCGFRVNTGYIIYNNFKIYSV